MVTGRSYLPVHMRVLVARSASMQSSLLSIQNRDVMQPWVVFTAPMYKDPALQSRWCELGAKTVEDAMASKGVKRLVLLSSFGIGDDFVPFSSIKVLVPAATFLKYYWIQTLRYRPVGLAALLAPIAMQYACTSEEHQTLFRLTFETELAFTGSLGFHIERCIPCCEEGLGCNGAGDAEQQPRLPPCQSSWTLSRRASHWRLEASHSQGEQTQVQLLFCRKV